jgi:hypothetical protein
MAAVERHARVQSRISGDVTNVQVRWGEASCRAERFRGAVARQEPCPPMLTITRDCTLHAHRPAVLIMYSEEHRSFAKPDPFR